MYRTYCIHIMYSIQSVQCFNFLIHQSYNFLYNIVSKSNKLDRHCIKLKFGNYNSANFKSNPFFQLKASTRAKSKSELIMKFLRTQMNRLLKGWNKVGVGVYIVQGPIHYPSQLKRCRRMRFSRPLLTKAWLMSCGWTFRRERWTGWTLKVGRAMVKFLDGSVEKLGVLFEVAVIF